MISTIQQRAKPFLKWAGGKGQLIEQIKSFLPEELFKGRIKKYMEPFLGGGAIFFWLSREFEFQEVFLYEFNKEIGQCYRTIKKDVHKLVKELRELEKEYFVRRENDREEFYYKKRVEYNSYLDKKNQFIRRSALIIFLNKTCFNGLYRVNSSGEFNVPFGRYKNPTICDEDNLHSVSHALQNAEIICGDFRLCLEHADAHSFVYFDPPYRPLSATANFNSYAKDTFDDDEQRRLKEVFVKLHKRGARVMLSNSDPRNINPKDDFFDDLYKDFDIRRLNAVRMINCQSDKRGQISEILVTSYNTFLSRKSPSMISTRKG